MHQMHHRLRLAHLSEASVWTPCLSTRIRPLLSTLWRHNLELDKTMLHTFVDFQFNGQISRRRQFVDRSKLALPFSGTNAIKSIHPSPSEPLALPLQMSNSIINASIMTTVTIFTLAWNGKNSIHHREFRKRFQMQPRLSSVKVLKIIANEVLA